MSAVYHINKGVNRSIEFKGIKAQYLGYLAIGLVVILVLYAFGYLIGINSYLLLGITLPSAFGYVLLITSLSKKFGETGLEKKIAKTKIPICVKSKTWKMFSLCGK